MSEVEKFALNMRKHVLEMVVAGKSSHVGAALSCADILAVLYCRIMKYDPAKPDWSLRDRFILSKGHAGSAVYAALALSGFFPESDLASYCTNGSVFSGHVSHKGVPGVEFSTGSLGHGLPVAVGMAHAIKMKHGASRVYVLVGDGEMMEGSNWESLLLSAHLGLNNLTLIVDRNFLQSIRSTEETVALNPLSEKLQSFGWRVIEIDGHNYHDISDALSSVSSSQPTAIIARTVKGKGISFMENRIEWHYKFPVGEQLTRALDELGGKE